jgi:hypothetical protein
VRAVALLRRAFAVTLAACALVAIAGAPASAQEEEEESPDVEGVEEVPLSTPPTTVASDDTTETTTPTSRLPQACTPIEPPYIVFRGTITAYQIPVFRFDVEEVRQGTWDLPQIDVFFPDDHRFLELGATYVVAAELDEDTGRLYSKVKWSSKSVPPAGTCPGEDPIMTVNDDGSAVDTGMFGGMKGRWPDILLAFAVPTLAIVALLLVLVGLKYLLVRVARTTPASAGWPGQG